MGFELLSLFGSHHYAKEEGILLSIPLGQGFSSPQRQSLFFAQRMTCSHMIAHHITEKIRSQKVHCLSNLIYL